MAHSNEHPTDEVNMIEIMRMLAEGRYWIAGITVAAAGLAVTMALLMTPVYRAEVTLTLVTDSPGASQTARLLGQFSGLAGLAGFDLSGLSRSDQIATPYLRSRSLAEEFIREKDLMPLLFSDSWDAVNETWTVPQDEAPTLWKATQRFIDDVRTVTVDNVTGLTTITIEWTDPVVAAEWANGLVALANENLRRRDLEEAERNIAYLNKQVARTNVVGLQQAMFNLIEDATKTLMLANARREYAFAIVDPAVPPESRARPKRKLMLVTGTLIGAFVGVVFVGLQRVVRHVRRRETA